MVVVCKGFEVLVCLKELLVYVICMLGYGLIGNWIGGVVVIVLLLVILVMIYG